MWPSPWQRKADSWSLNAFEPVIHRNLFESIMTLTNGVNTFIDNCIDGITANEKHCADLVHGSVGLYRHLPQGGVSAGGQHYQRSHQNWGLGPGTAGTGRTSSPKRSWTEILDVYALTK